MGVDRTGGEDMALAGNCFGARADHDIDVVADIWITRLADGADAAISDANIRLHNAPPIKDQRIGNHRVYGAGGAAALALTHAIANYFAAAKFHLIAIAGEILFHLKD